MQLLLDAQELRHFLFFDRHHRHARPARDDFFDIFFTDHAHRGLINVVLFAQQAQVLALLALFVRVESRLLKFVVGDGVLHAMDHELDTLLHVNHFLGQGALPQLDARARFVNQVHGLVGKVAVRDVAVRMVHGGGQSVVRVGDGVEFFVAVFDAEKYLDGFLLVRRWHLDGLEAPLERAVFFDRLAVFRRSCSANALDLTA